jgi:hypothetical protein
MSLTEHSVDYGTLLEMGGRVHVEVTRSGEGRA